MRRLVGLLLPLATIHSHVVAAAQEKSTPATRPAFHLVAQLQHPAIAECSGIVASRKHKGVHWVHNDSGHPPALFAVDPDGKFLAQYVVAAANIDWEDIADDDAGHLYLADTGNNERKRNQVLVHQVAEPDPARPSPTPPRLPVLKTWRLQYPDQPFDCEALFIHDGSGYLISKLFLAGRATVYRFPLDAPHDRPVQLERVCALPIFSPVTAADISPDRKRLAVLSVAGLNLFTIDGDVKSAQKAAPQFVPHVDPLAEAVCFSGDALLVATEARRLYRIETPAAAPPENSPRTTP